METSTASSRRLLSRGKMIDKLINPIDSQFRIYQNQEGELDKNSVIRNFRTTVTDGKEYQVEYYNPDVIISVGYRVKSQQAHREILSKV